jgi:hypothetical protein
MARMAVGDTELRTMLRIVNAPDDADEGEPLPRSVLAALVRLFRADTVYFMRLDVKRREVPLYQEYGRIADVDDQDAPSVSSGPTIRPRRSARIPTAPATSPA